MQKCENKVDTQLCHSAIIFINVIHSIENRGRERGTCAILSLQTSWHRSRRVHSPPPPSLERLAATGTYCSSEALPLVLWLLARSHRHICARQRRRLSTGLASIDGLARAVNPSSSNQDRGDDECTENRNTRATSSNAAPHHRFLASELSLNGVSNSKIFPFE